MDMNYTKVKFDGAKVRIEYEVERKDGGEADEYSLFSADRPAPEFNGALQALAQDVVTICELPADDWKKLTVRGVTLTHTNGILGACITALKALETANAPLVINTPHLPSKSYSGDDSGPTMHPGMAVRLDALCLQASRYVDGDRAQAKLFTAAPQDTAQELTAIA